MKSQIWVWALEIKSPVEVLYTYGSSGLKVFYMGLWGQSSKQLWHYITFLCKPLSCNSEAFWQRDESEADTVIIEPPDEMIP